MKTKDFRRELDKLTGKKEQIQLDLRNAKKKLRDSKLNLIHHEKAKEIIREVGLKTQQQLQFHISDITSLALESVFDNPYKVKLDFVSRRNKTECDIYFERDGNRISPMDASGGGAIEVASFALRIASWSLENPSTRNTIILDEPVHFIDETLKDKASEMIKEVSEKLGIQFIIVTHEPKLTAYADRIFEVTKNKRTGVSKVKEY